jgi:drug/metabolite transporter (DMT)-like permease
LFVLVRMRAASSAPRPTRDAPASVNAPTERASSTTRGSWPSAFALFAYAAAFSLAYLRLGAGVGALVLFACVQATMIGWGIKCGERPSRVEWSGFAIALAGLAVLTLPGAVAPDPIGLALMMIAGVAWGAYSLRGRSSRAPLVSTADNFARSVPMAIVGAVVGAIIGIKSTSSSVHIDANGVWLALASGCVASGLGYSLWYSALPGLTAARAAIVQLVVPILAATLGIVVLGEELSARLAIAALMILGGIALAIAGRRKPALGCAPARADRSDRADCSGESSPLNAETPAR